MEQATLDIQPTEGGTIVRVKTTGTFTFPLTEAEKATTMDQVASFTKTLAETQAEWDKVKKQYKKEIDDLDACIAGFIGTVEIGVEKTVECWKTTNFAEGTVIFTDADGVVLQERPITDSDKQLTLAPDVQAAVQDSLVEHSSQDEAKEIRQAARTNTSALDSVSF